MPFKTICQEKKCPYNTGLECRLGRNHPPDYCPHMDEVELGELQKRVYKGGQPVLVHENYSFFLLHEPYHVAGRDMEWERGIEGVGLNNQIVHAVDLSTLIVEHDKSHYILEDEKEANKMRGTWTDQKTGKPLNVYPLYCFRKVQIQDEDNIKRKLCFEKK